MHVYRTTAPRWSFSPTPWLLVILMAAAGIGASVYLAYLHYAVHTMIGFSSFCAYSKAVNCDTVAQSGYSVFLGVPVAVWGIFGYGFLGFLAFLGMLYDHSGRRIWVTVYVLTALFVLVSVSLAAVSTFLIRSKCVICFGTYALNLLVFFFVMAMRSRRRVLFRHGFLEDLRFLRRVARVSRPGLLAFAITAAACLAFYPTYWEVPSAISFSHFQQGVTEDGYPWIGAENAKLTIVEFTDYQCFYCRKAHFFLKGILADHPDSVKLIVRHYPLDRNCNPKVEESIHSGGCDLAVWALAALRLGRFWEMHEALFGRDLEKTEVSLREMAQAAGLRFEELIPLLSESEVLNHLSRDILFGARLGIDATPAYVVNGKVYLGNLDPQLLKELE